MKKKRKNKIRDLTILAAYRREIDLREKKVPNKKRYIRKIKHKGKLYD
jgi:uncharacterized protein YkvS